MLNRKLELSDNALILDGLDECIIGISKDGATIYGYDEMIEHFIEDSEMTEIEAIEWIEYNIFGLASCGKFLVVQNLL